eukprot:scaffold51251_cov98-Phaeocystis_antarctica.AAC.1
MRSIASTRSSWETLSKAFSKSRNTKAPSPCSSSTAAWRRASSRVLSSIDRPGTNPVLSAAAA